MKQSIAILSALAAFGVAEVPLEQAHMLSLVALRGLLEIENRFEIVDPVFGFLGDAAAIDGAGLVENLACLHQITADEGFTNALTLLDDEARINGLANALIFRALEKNTVEVGLLSVDCDEAAVNPEIDALSQHQDPAADGAAAINKAIALELAIQLATIGADPTLALLAGTFAPGEIGDPTAAGNTCNDDTDPIGCIFTENLIVADASVEELNAAVIEALGEGAPLASEALAADLGLFAAQFASGEFSAVAAGGVVAGGAVAGAQQACEQQVAGQQAAAQQVGALNFGECADPTIQFAEGLDGRNEAAFAPNDGAQFSQGSANNVNIITSFICGQLSSACEADEAAVQACEEGAAAADGLEGQAAVNAFNGALGL